MSFKSELYTHLTANSALVALVSTRIYPQFAPTSAVLPYITFSRIVSDSTHHTGGASGIVREQFQFSCWAQDAVTLTSVSEALRTALDGFRGLFTTVGVNGSFLVSENDDYLPPDDGSQAGVFRTMMDVDFWHDRSVPTF